MSIAHCIGCDRNIDTDGESEGLWLGNHYVCERCGSNTDNDLWTFERLARRLQHTPLSLTQRREAITAAWSLIRTFEREIPMFSKDAA